MIRHGPEALKLARIVRHQSCIELRRAEGSLFFILANAATLNARLRMPGHLNAIFSTRAMKRRYEVWFLRLALADGSGAWWIRYLLLNLGRSYGGGCSGRTAGEPVQIWATWFPRGGTPESYVKGFSQNDLEISKRFASPFMIEFSGNRIDENSCRAAFEIEGHLFSWDLRYRSTAAYSMGDKGWLGFSRTPHADAVFSGRITYDDRTWEHETLGFGVQGHNCGYRHRRFWTWAHVAVSLAGGENFSSFEAVEYETPLSRRFHRALLWHEGRLYDFDRLKIIERSTHPFRWTVHCSRPKDATTLVAIVDGTGSSAHRLPYQKTNCTETFEVHNNSLASAKLYLKRGEEPPIEFLAPGGAVLEMANQ